MPIRIAALYRYPVKGLSAERLAHVALLRGECLPQDRRFAIALVATHFDPARPEWLPKTNFAMLMRDEILAELQTRFDAESGVLTVKRQSRTLFQAPITNPAGRDRAARFFGDFLGGRLQGPPRLVEAPGHTFSDARRKPNATTYKYVSLVSLASIGALEKVVERPVDPIRFRANVYLEGLPAWRELDWIGAEITAGGAQLRVVSAISRCAATHVNPATAARDLDVVGSLQRAFGHINMGVYAEVISGGDIAEGDALAPPATA
jgi:uncharacterized protein YcbX